MRYKSFGNPALPTILLLHGGGLSWWSWQPVISSLEKDFHVVAAVIDGHGEDYGTPFESIEAAADKILDTIEKEYDGHVHAICGLSIGAQITVELLFKKKDITNYAVIESALVFPIKGITLLTVPTYKLFYGLIKQKWFSKLQAKSLYVPEALFDAYYEDSIKMSKSSLINMTLSNGNYAIKDGLSLTSAKALILAGEKELDLMKKSARLLSRTLCNSELQILPGLKHGELSLTKPSEYDELVKAFFSK